VIKKYISGNEIVFAMIWHCVLPLGLAAMASLLIPLPWWEGSEGREIGIKGEEAL
jgi:hypothetical protein